MTLDAHQLLVETSKLLRNLLSMFPMVFPQIMMGLMMSLDLMAPTSIHMN